MDITCTLVCVFMMLQYKVTKIIFSEGWEEEERVKDKVNLVIN